MELLEKIFQQGIEEIMVRGQSVYRCFMVGEMEDEMWLQLQFLLINKDS